MAPDGTRACSAAENACEATKLHASRCHAGLPGSQKCMLGRSNAWLRLPHRPATGSGCHTGLLGSQNACQAAKMHASRCAHGPASHPKSTPSSQSASLSLPHGPARQPKCMSGNQNACPQMPHGPARQAKCVLGRKTSRPKCVLGSQHIYKRNSCRTQHRQNIRQVTWTSKRF